MSAQNYRTLAMFSAERAHLHNLWFVYWRRVSALPRAGALAGWT